MIYNFSVVSMMKNNYLFTQSDFYEKNWISVLSLTRKVFGIEYTQWIRGNNFSSLSFAEVIVFHIGTWLIPASSPVHMLSRSSVSRWTLFLCHPTGRSLNFARDDDEVNRFYFRVSCCVNSKVNGIFLFQPM